MENIPEVVLQKIENYVIDLFRKDHVEKFNTTLISLQRIHCLYIRNRWDYNEGLPFQWKIRCSNGIYRILRYFGKDIPTHWLNIHCDIIEGTRPIGFGDETYTLV